MTTTDRAAKATFCRAAMHYAPDGGLKDGPGPPTEVDILDGRQSELPGWKECGFERLHHTSHVVDWTDDEEIAGVHYGEIEQLARETSGATHALVSDHVKRNAEQANKREREQNPVRLVHSDFAAGYHDVVRTSYRNVHGRGAATLARTGVTPEQIENAGRIVMLQFWRNLGARKMDFPVAWCDSRTVTPDEGRPFLYTGYVAGGKAFDALAIATPSDPTKHAWYTFPELAADEVVVFRTYDTDLVAQNKTWFTPHSAFHDPDVEVGNPARFSIELRVMCLFD